MSEISHAGNTLKIGNEDIHLRSEIKEVTQLPNKILVTIMADPDDRPETPSNIVCYSYNGDFLWSIDVPDRSASYGEPSYKGVVVEDGNVYAYNWNTYKYRVDLDDGSIEELHKAGK